MARQWMVASPQQEEGRRVQPRHAGQPKVHQLFNQVILLMDDLRQPLGRIAEPARRSSTGSTTKRMSADGARRSFDFDSLNSRMRRFGYLPNGQWVDLAMTSLESLQKQGPQARAGWHHLRHALLDLHLRLGPHCQRGLPRVMKHGSDRGLHLFQAVARPQPPQAAAGGISPSSNSTTTLSMLPPTRRRSQHSLRCRLMHQASCLTPSHLRQVA
mmetsp:Transcript_60421/g.112199  ORF Transcript_60421/g.112199 Transcript_60421/m.112199 type:complete len:214 (-) Transcript_60421:425-1066(-)